MIGARSQTGIFAVHRKRKQTRQSFELRTRGLQRRMEYVFPPLSKGSAAADGSTLFREVHMSSERPDQAV